MPWQIMLRTSLEQIHENLSENGKIQPGRNCYGNGHYGRQYQSNLTPSHGLNRCSSGQQSGKNFT